MSMKQKPRRRYTAEFKSQAIELLQAGRPVPELRALRRELTRLRQENDILKKAAVILGTKHQPNSEP
jgi:transposase-like protein